jgi:hypothetical protein
VVRLFVNVVVDGKLEVKFRSDNGGTPSIVLSSPPTLPIGPANPLINGARGAVKPVERAAESVDLKQFASVPSLI